MTKEVEGEMGRKLSHWKKYGTCCVKCNKTEEETKLTRHHIITKNNDRSSDIVVMCLECHDKEHEKIDGICRYDSLLKEVGYYRSQFLKYRNMYNEKYPDDVIHIKKRDFDAIIVKATAYDKMTPKVSCKTVSLECISRSGEHQHDCLCNDKDPECDNIPTCRLCGEIVW